MPILLDCYHGGPSAVAIGTFDGVHRGHQALLRRARDGAEAGGWTGLALTFPLPPGNYLGRAKPLIVPPALKYALLEQIVEAAVVVDFPRVGRMPPERFVEEVLVRRLRARLVVVGQDYRFGADRAGDVLLLERLGERLGFAVEAVSPVLDDGEPISSTTIRRALRSGAVERAGHLLGRPPILCGRVVRGTGRGKRLGYPTANLRLEGGLVTPQQGIFAGIACLKGRPYRAAVYIGARPTFEPDQGRARAVEVHLLDGVFPALYDEALHVHLIRKLRDDRRFPDADALRAQIREDVQALGRLLKEVPSVACPLA